MAAIRASAGKGRKLCTTWEVVGEVYTLFRMRLAPPDSAEPALVVLRWARESGIELLATAEADHQRAAALLERYGQLRLSYVDALLLALAERHRVEEMITVDARHFGSVRAPRSDPPHGLPSCAPPAARPRIGIKERAICAAFISFATTSWVG